MKKSLKGIFLMALLSWTLFPTYWMLSIAIRSDKELGGIIALVPKSFTFKHLIGIFAEENFALAIFNSLIITIVSLSLALFVGVCCSYILSRARFNFKGKKAFLLWILLVRILPPIAFVLPLYILMNSYGILNTKIPIILAHTLINIPFIIWFMMSFLSGIPKELEESAKIDGASEWQIFRLVILPLVLPGIAAVTIFSFMTSWNEYLYGVVFVQSPKSFTIPLKLATLNSEQELIEWGKVASGGIISLIPVTLATIFMQKYLISGLTAGSVKE